MLAEESPTPVNLALFDLDGTLIPRIPTMPSASSWCAGLGRRRGPPPRNDEFYRQYQAGTLDIDAYVEFATGPWRARPLAEQAAASSASWTR
jgi:phosphoserine phosphatase